MSRRGVLLSIAALLAAGQAPMTPGTQAGINWYHCVMTAGLSYARGTDSAEVVARVAVDACPEEQRIAIDGLYAERRSSMTDEMLMRAAYRKMLVDTAEARIREAVLAFRAERSR